MNNNPEISQERLELIERYLLGQMDVSEVADFETKLQSDHLLQQQLDDQKLLMIAIEESVLKSKLDGFHSGIRDRSNQNTFLEQAVVRQMPWKKWLSVAAVFLVVASTAWWLLLKPGREQQLFASYYQPDPGLMTTMGGTEEYDFNRAMIDYKSGNFDSAITRWTRQLSVRPASDTLQYFLGSAQLARKNYKEALSHFQNVTLLPASSFFAEANWYAALAAIQTGDRKAAAKYLAQSNRPEKERLLAELNQ